jgi:hypothetical protein
LIAAYPAPAPVIVGTVKFGALIGSFVSLIAGLSAYRRQNGNLARSSTFAGWSEHKQRSAISEDFSPRPHPILWLL